MWTKKAQKEGMAVAIIIGVILAFMLVYIIVAPPEVRDELLNQTDSLETSATIETDLISETPGRVSPRADKKTSHKLPTINLYFKDEPFIDKLANQLSVSRTWWSKKAPTLRFSIDGLENIKESELILAIQEADGSLEVLLNDNLVYDSELMPGIQTINLPASYLQEDNELILETSFPFFPWSSNKYTFTEVSLREIFELINSKAEKFISLEQEEIDGLESAELRFNQICNLAPKRSSDLRILLNDEEIYNSEAFCVSTLQKIDVPLDLLVDGRNSFMFLIEEGDFTFSNLKLETESKQGKYPTYYFKISETTLSNINQEVEELMLSMVFMGTKQKEAIILINNKQIKLDTNEQIFSADLKEQVKEGTNVLKIIPSNSFDIVALDVSVV